MVGPDPRITHFFFFPPKVLQIRKRTYDPQVKKEHTKMTQRCQMWAQGPAVWLCAAH